MLFPSEVIGMPQHPSADCHGGMMGYSQETITLVFALVLSDRDHRFDRSRDPR